LCVRPQDLTKKQIIERLESEWSAASMGIWINTEKLKHIEVLLLEQGSDALPEHIKVRAGACVAAFVTAPLRRCFRARSRSLLQTTLSLVLRAVVVTVPARAPRLC
jgi:hypothetical protein